MSKLIEKTMFRVALYCLEHLAKSINNRLDEKDVNHIKDCQNK